MVEKIEITDINNPIISIYNSRAETTLYRMNEPKPGIFIAETELVIRRALDAGYTPISMLTLKESLDNLSDLINDCDKAFVSDNFCNTNNINSTIYSYNLKVYYSNYETLKELLGFPLTRGVACAMQRKELPSVEEVLEGAKNIAILCDVENPTNVGTIFRSAAALNIDAVILYGSCSDPLYRRSLRSSMGCTFSIPWTFCNDLNAIKNMGYLFAAFALRDDSLTLSEFANIKTDKKAILLGNEGYGLSDGIINMCDNVVKIPMREGIDSLNVAVASGIAFYELSK
jgi:tRNA G18 (ribose-2'-O)-methylase SpoU